MTKTIQTGLDGGRDYSPSQEVKAMDTDQDVSISIYLQEVAIHGVKHQASVNTKGE